MRATGLCIPSYVFNVGIDCCVEQRISFLAVTVTYWGLGSQSAVLAECVFLNIY
jgi:hypothetical protein